MANALTRRLTPLSRGVTTIGSFDKSVSKCYKNHATKQTNKFRPLEVSQSLSAPQAPVRRAKPLSGALLPKKEVKRKHLPNALKSIFPKDELIWMSGSAS